MTSEFNPNTPAPMTLKTLQKICDQLNKKSAVMAKTLTDAVGAKGSQRRILQTDSNRLDTASTEKGQGQHLTATRFPRGGTQASH